MPAPIMSPKASGIIAAPASSARVTVGELQVLRIGEDHAEEREERDADRGGSDVKRGLRKNREVEHRLGCAAPRPKAAIKHRGGAKLIEESGSGQPRSGASMTP